MCLYTSQNKPKVAKKAIRCMKVVKRKGDCEYSPMFCWQNRDVSYRVGCETKIMYFEGDEFAEPLNVEPCSDVITEEYWRVEHGLHSYTVGNRNISTIVSLYENKYVILECEIPVGALYYEGHSNMVHSPSDERFESETSYCSDRLSVIREVSLFEFKKIYSVL